MPRAGREWWGLHENIPGSATLRTHQGVHRHADWCPQATFVSWGWHTPESSGQRPHMESGESAPTRPCPPLDPQPLLTTRRPVSLGGAGAGTPWSRPAPPHSWAQPSHLQNGMSLWSLHHQSSVTVGFRPRNVEAKSRLLEQSNHSQSSREHHSLDDKKKPELWHNYNTLNVFFIQGHNI